jgi:hypothetical protein
MTHFLEPILVVKQCMTVLDEIITKDRLEITFNINKMFTSQPLSL